ncbi:MAG: hypothetical protein QJR01_09715 [Kyrpidia sp.]|nr:hypothetical protein [Kyrpidia sp.]
MAVLIPTVLVLAILALILGPFLRGAPDGGSPPPIADDLLEREEMLLAERLDIEYDYQMGKLTYDEYRRLTELWEADIRTLGEGAEGAGFLRRLEQELQDRLERLDSRVERSPGHIVGQQSRHAAEQPWPGAGQPPAHAADQKEGTEVERSANPGSSGTSRTGTP